MIVTSARGREEDRILGLHVGADDYLAKPYSPRELSARVKALLRRVGSVTTEVLRYGELEIDLRTREVRSGGDLVELTRREFDLLAVLASEPRRVFTREQLLDRVWHSSSQWQSAATVTEHVRRLRNKLEEHADGPRRIVTVTGVGYRFES